ncbi:MAG: hemolysin family protein [Chloroflexi bacterium]|nr:hemolysin family protein [Chloroflexota bacterium]MBU1749541.1 hemolysin family protein [Chloroflexota bacterium]
MDPGSTTVGELVLLGLLILLNGFFASAEIAIISANKFHLKQQAEAGNRTAKLILQLAENSSRLLATIQIGVTMAGFLASASAALSLSHTLRDWLHTLAIVPQNYLDQFAEPLAVIIVTTLLALVMLVLGELVPKSVALHYAQRISYLSAWPIHILAMLAYPVVQTLTLTTDAIAWLFGVRRRSALPFITAEEIKTMVDAGEEEGVFESEEKAMIYSVFDFGDTLTREVMVPRIDVVAVSVDTPLDQVLDTIIEAGFSRIPVYQDSIDDVVGVLYAKDLLRRMRDDGLPGRAGDLVRSAYFVPETKKVDDLLRELQRDKVHMAVVVDEYGGTAGVVTIEDLVEEIVGEIQDEYDWAEELLVEKVSAREGIFNARIGLDDVNQLMDLDLTTEDVDTLGGLIYSHLGRVPDVGDTVQVKDAEVTVLSLAGRRIKRVRVTKLAEPDPLNADAAPGD